MVYVFLLFWGSLGGYWGLIGGSLLSVTQQKKVVTRLPSNLGGSWGILGAPWGSPEGFLGSPGGLLEVSWGFLGSRRVTWGSPGDMLGSPGGLLTKKRKIYSVKQRTNIAKPRCECTLRIGTQIKYYPRVSWGTPRGILRVSQGLHAFAGRTPPLTSHIRTTARVLLDAR